MMHKHNSISNRKEKREIFMAEKIREGKVRCSFCHKSEDQVRKLIAGPEGVFICDECIGICSEIMEEELAQYGAFWKIYDSRYQPAETGRDPQDP